MFIVGVAVAIATACYSAYILQYVDNEHFSILKEDKYSSFTTTNVVVITTSVLFCVVIILQNTRTTAAAKERELQQQQQLRLAEEEIARLRADAEERELQQQQQLRLAEEEIARLRSDAEERELHCLPSYSNCDLCVEAMRNPVTLPCGHFFCKTCVESYLKTHPRCPICRKEIPSEFTRGLEACYREPISVSDSLRRFVS